MVFKVNGGIINQQVLAGGLRFFKITGPFAWTISDGTVNLPVAVIGGPLPGASSYFAVGNGKPVPGSAADLVLQTISQQATIVVMGLVPSLGAATTEIDIAVSATAFGWGSDSPNYTTSPGPEVNLPTTPTPAATEMQAALVALPSLTVYVSVGASPNQSATPVTSTVSFASVTVTEVSFSLGSLTYYNLA